MFPHPVQWLVAASLIALAGPMPADTARSSLAPSGKGCPLSERMWPAPASAKAKAGHSAADVRILSFGP
jgi:hypothetical protein